MRHDSSEKFFEKGDVYIYPILKEDITHNTYILGAISNR